MQRMERMDILEKKLETKNVEVENLQQQVKEGELQFESRVEEEIANLKSELTMQNADLQNQLKEVDQNRSELAMQIADLQNQCKAEVKKELEKVLPTAVEQGLRDLPFEMVCAYRYNWETVGVVNYDRITVEFNNSDRPGGLFVQIYSNNIHTGGDGTMNIETGVFTTVTSGHYIITYSGTVVVDAGEFTNMYLYHNGVKLEESRWYARFFTC